MPAEAQLRLGSIRLAVQPRLRIRRGGVCIVRPLLTPEIHRRIAAARRLIVRLRPLRLEALVTSPGLDQRAIDREVLVGQQTALAGQVENLLEKTHVNLAGQESLAVLGEHGGIPDRIVHAQANEPSEEKVVRKLLDQESLASNGVEHLEEQSAQELLRRNRGPSPLRVQPPEIRRQIGQHRIDKIAQRAKGMFLRYSALRRDIAEQVYVVVIVTAHSAILLRAQNSRSTCGKLNEVGNISATC